MENTPPSAICIRGPEIARRQSLRPRDANCLLGRIFQFIPTRGSVLPFFFPARECIGNCPSNSRGVLTVHKFNTLPLYKKECIMYTVQTRLLTQVKITFPPDVWMLEDTVVSKEGGDFVVCGFIISEYLS